MTEIKTADINLEMLVEKIDKLGYPTRLKEVLSPEQISEFHDLLVKKDDGKAYILGNKAGDKDLVDKARASILSDIDDKSRYRLVTETLAFGYDQKDSIIIDKASAQLLEGSSFDAYRYGIRYNDEKLADAARDLMIKRMPDSIYEVAHRADDQILFKKLAIALASKDSIKAFRIANRLKPEFSDERTYRQNLEFDRKTRQNFICEIGEVLLEQDPIKALTLADEFRNNYNSSGLIHRAGLMVVDEHPELVYSIGKDNKNKDLMHLAKLAILKRDDPKELFYVGKKENDMRFIRKAGERLLSTPLKAYEAALALEDNDLMRKAGYALIMEESNMEECHERAYWIGNRLHDEALLDKVTESFIRFDPKKAYEFGKSRRYETLKEKALQAMPNTESKEAIILSQLYK